MDYFGPQELVFFELGDADDLGRKCSTFSGIQWKWWGWSNAGGRCIGRTSGAVSDCG
jgi:hypothetical protein